jgi:hypothetical protein
LEPKDALVTLKAKLLLAALAASLLSTPATGMAEEASQPPPPQKKTSEPAARRKRARPLVPKPVAQKPPETPDCPRAQYKGDPVCFGGEDAAGLPMPSSRSGHAAPRRTEDVTLSAKTRLNQPTDSPTYFNNPNPHPSGNDFGGGVGVGFHF